MIKNGLLKAMVLKLKRIILLSLIIFIPNICFATDFTNDPNCVFAALLDETSGNCADSCGVAVGTVTGATQNVLGKFGNAVSFDNAGDYVDWGDLTIVDGINTATWCWWKKRQNSSGNDSIIRKDGSWTPDQTGGSEWTATLWTTVYSPDYSMGAASQNADNAWSHFCYTYNGTTRQAWKNGSTLGSGFGDTGNMANAASSFYLGGAAADESYEGDLDEIIIFNDVLSSTEINDLKDNGIIAVSSNPPTILLLNNVILNNAIIN